MQKLQQSGVQMSERLVSLGIMGAQLRIPPETPLKKSIKALWYGGA